MSNLYYETELYHYGVKGMKWGVRKYQNKDGTLTKAGQKRLAKSIQKSTKDVIVESDRGKTQKHLYEDLRDHYQEPLKPHITKIREKKAIYDRICKKEKLGQLFDRYFVYGEDGAADKDMKKAYDQTFDYFKKNNPKYLDSIIKKNGGSKENLNHYLDFGQMYNKNEAKAYEQGLKEFYKKKGVDVNKLDKAYQDYTDECKKASDAILGSFAKTPIKKVDKYEDDIDVQKVVTETLMNYDRYKSIYG